MGVSLGVDPSELDVCFGGFSPASVGDITQALTATEESEEHVRQRSLNLDHRATIEVAHASAPREALDAQGTRWHYAVLDDTKVCIVGCQPACDHLMVPDALEGLPVVALGDSACANISGVVSIEVPDTVLFIGYKAMCGMHDLEQVSLPDSITTIGEHAFSHTSLRSFVAPQRLRAIGERAFFDCACLRDVRLNEGLVGVGAHAFTRTAIEQLVLPSSVQRIGHPVAADAPLRYAGEDATLTIREGGSLRIDHQGALLRHGADGLHLEWVMDPDARELRVPDGVVSVDARALLNHKGIQMVELPDSVTQIGDAAFKGCRNLRQVRLGRGVQRIGAEAFLDTAVKALAIPACLEHIGTMALVTQGAHSGRAPTSLRQIHVDADNERFCVEGGLLLETVAPGQQRVVHYLDVQPDVRIPDTVVAVAPYAFSGTRNLRSLRMSSVLSDIGIRALAVDGLVEVVRIDMEAPLEGHDVFEIRFPNTDRGIHQQFVAFTTQTAVSVQHLLEHYDNAIINASSFDAVLGGVALDRYDQVLRIIERLRDPVFLTDVNRQMLERVLRRHLEEVCVAVAKHDDRAAIDALVELGFVHADNIDGLIEQVGRVQDAAMTGYLLEVRRRAFGHAALDFTL